MADKKRKVCTICGMGFVPTSNNQRYCPDCQAGRKPNAAYIKARQPGEVRIIIPKQTCAGSGGNGCKETIETPEKTLQQVETPENPAPPDGWEAWNEEQKNIDLPDGLAVIEEHAEILRRYYKGELVDKTQFLAEIREKLGNL